MFALPGGLWEISTAAAAPEPPAAVRQALQAGLAASEADPGVASFYRSRGFRPLWVTDAGPRVEAWRVLELLRHSEEHGLEPAPAETAALRRALQAAQRGGDLAAAELATATAYAGFLRRLRSPPTSERLEFVDAGLPAAPPTSGYATLQAAGRAPDLARHIDDAVRMNPLYEALRAELSAARASGDRVRADRLRANLDRLRALPQDLGSRHLVVNVASQTLRAYENGVQVDEMKVVVGRRSAKTPVMAGLIRYARFNPYWNIPESMVRDEIAPQVLRDGPAMLARRRLQALSDWSPQARELTPEEVDWAAVAAGRKPLRLRQLAGGDNFLGQVKLMLPNELGIYLHDTPERWAFAADQRALSAGCIRLEDAGRLTRWLLEWPSHTPFTRDINQRADLPRPVPVYILYLTEEPAPGGVRRAADIYRRDAALRTAAAGADQNRRL